MTALVVGLLLAAAVLVHPDPASRARGPRPGTARPAGGAWAGQATSATRGEPTAGDMLKVLDMVAAQVRAGAEPSAAWAVAVDVAGAELPVTDPESVLRSLADSPPGRWHPRRRETVVPNAARAAAAAWRLAQRTGAPLGDLLDAVCASLRDHRSDLAAVEASLAAPRATVRILLVLPLAGIGLGQLVGAQPVDVLLTTAAGRTSGLLAGVLLVVGRLWMGRLVAQVERAGQWSTSAGAG